MRLRIADRILVAIAGLLLLAICAGIVAQMFFSVDLVSLAVRAFSSDAPQVRWGLIGLAAVFLLLGGYCVMVLFRHRRRKDKFILQKNDSGELAISVKALEHMVQKCVDQHPEMDIQHLYLENRKDGLLIRLRGSVAGGISIPLTVEALQKQIRQYVTACSGVEIKGIRVQIESSGGDAADAPFTIAPPAAKPLLKEPAPETAAVYPAEAPAAAPEAAAVSEPAPVEPVQEIRPVSPEPVIPVPDEDDDRPLHQRLFSAEPEACIVPAPPAEPAEAVTDDPAAASDAEDEPDGLQPEIPEAEEPAISRETTDSAESEEADGQSAPEQESPDGMPENAWEALNDPEGSEASEQPEKAEEASGTEAPKADPEFLASLSAFDQIVTGKKDEAE